MVSSRFDMPKNKVSAAQAAPVATADANGRPLVHTTSSYEQKNNGDFKSKLSKLQAVASPDMRRGPVDSNHDESVRDRLARLGTKLSNA